MPRATTQRATIPGAAITSGAAFNPAIASFKPFGGFNGKPRPQPYALLVVEAASIIVPTIAHRTASVSKSSSIAQDLGCPVAENCDIGGCPDTTTTSNVCTLGTATADSTDTGDSRNQPFRAFNGVLASGWISSTGYWHSGPACGVDHWLQFQFYSPTEVASYAVTSRGGACCHGSDTPSGWKLEGSSDGETYVIHTRIAPCCGPFGSADCRARLRASPSWTLVR